MKIQNVYFVNDNNICPHGKGEIIYGYVQGVLLRAAKEVVKVRESIDWIVINSEPFWDVVCTNLSFFEEELESILQENNPQRNWSIIKEHTRAQGGAFPEKSFNEMISRCLNENPSMVYLNEKKFGTCYVGYHVTVEVK